MDFDSLMFKFSERQIDGPYDASGYRKYAAAYSNRDIDKETVRAFGEVETADVKVLTPGAREAVLAFDAHFAMSLLASAFLEHPLDTTDPLQWFELFDMICCCNRMLVYSGVKFEGFASNTDAIWFCSVAVDMMSRLSSRDWRDSAIVTENVGATYRRRAMSVFCDIVCGRGGIWSEFALDMARITCAVHGMDFDEAYGAYATARYGMMRAHVSRILHDDENFDDFLVGMVVNVCAGYDGWQNAVYIASFDSDGIEIDDALSQGAVYDDIFMKVMPYLNYDDPLNKDSHGYIREFGVDIVKTLFVLPDEVCNECILAYGAADVLGEE